MAKKRAKKGFGRAPKKYPNIPITRVNLDSKFFSYSDKAMGKESSSHASILDNAVIIFSKKQAEEAELLVTVDSYDNPQNLVFRFRDGTVELKKERKIPLSRLLEGSVNFTVKSVMDVGNASNTFMSLAVQIDGLSNEESAPKSIEKTNDGLLRNAYSEVLKNDDTQEELEDVMKDVEGELKGDLSKVCELPERFYQYLTTLIYYETNTMNGSLRPLAHHKIQENLKQFSLN